MADVQTSPGFVDMGAGRRDEPVIYYKKPDGWIVAGATQMSAQMGMMRKGCIPLPKYGRISHSEDFWGPILRHPDGPAEFPLEQILSFKWYRPEMLGDLREIVLQGRDYVRVGQQPKVVFPQLKGIKITEFPCPECPRVFHQPIHLGAHLRVMHDYDRSEIIKYGDAMHIDFTKVPGGKQVLTFEMDAEQKSEADAVEEIEVAYETVSAQSPASVEKAAEFESAASQAPRLDCPDCGWVNEKNTQQGLDIHKRRWCKAVPV